MAGTNDLLQNLDSEVILLEQLNINKNMSNDFTVISLV